MKRQLFLYLFLFAVLLLIFQYMNEKSIFESQEEQIESLKTKLERSKKEADSLRNRVLELNYFNLMSNDNAMTYLENRGFEASEIEAYISDQIFEKNFGAENNPLVPYAGIQGGMKINKLRFLNHRWIIADFTDGMYWGEVLLGYHVEDDGSIEFENLGSLIYTH